MRAEAAVLFANESFYDAFRDRDLETMELLWAQRHPVACLHPGWPVLSTRESIMDSWQGIFASPAAPKIACYGAEVFILDAAAFVVCYEAMAGNTVLVATNIFVREDGQWRMVHHQAGPCHEPPPPPEEAQSGPSGLQ